MGRPYTEARKEANKRWDAGHLDRLGYAAPAGHKDKVKAAAEAAGQSVNRYILDAVLQRMERDKAGN